MPENIFLKELESSKNPFLEELSAGGGWDEANAEGGSVMENTAARSKRPVKEEGIFARAERLRQEKLAKLKSQPIATILNQIKVDPFSAVGGAYSDAKELLTGERSEMAPEASLPSLVKGAAGVPLRVSQGVYNIAMPDSPEANAANRMVDDANNWYWRRGLDESKYGEAIGASALTAGMPMGAGAKFMQGGGRLAQLGKSMGMGSAANIAASQIMTPKENIQSSQQFKDEALQDAIYGGLTGLAMPLAQEGAGEGARRLSPYLRDFKDFLRSKISSMSREGHVKPHLALRDDLAQREAASAGYGGRLYEAQRNGPDSNKVVPDETINDINNFVDRVVSDLKTRNPEPSAVIAGLEKFKNRMNPKFENTPIYDENGSVMANLKRKVAEPEAKMSIRNFIDTSRNLREDITSAYNSTTGGSKSPLRAGELDDIMDGIETRLSEGVFKVSPSSSIGIDRAKAFWKGGSKAIDEGDLYAAPVTYKAKELGGTVRPGLESATGDVKMSNLVRGKSAKMAENISDMTSKRGEHAIQVELLQQAEKADKMTDPQQFIKVFVDKDGDLLPMVKQAFKGDDLKALQGFIRLKRFSDIAGKTTNIGGGALLGAALGGPLGVGGSLAGGATGTSLALWGRRGTWAPNFTARGWERLVNNRASRAALAVIAKAPPTSPQFAKAMAIVKQAAEGQEDE